jgi:hypothetical protein
VICHKDAAPLAQAIMLVGVAGRRSVPLAFGGAGLAVREPTVPRHQRARR